MHVRTCTLQYHLPVLGEGNYTLTELPEIGSDGHREIWQMRVREVGFLFFMWLKSFRAEATAS